MAGEFKIQGLEPALAKMWALGPDLAARGLVIAGRKGMAVVRSAAKKGAKRLDDPETTRSIAENVSVSAKFNKRKNYAVVKVGIAGGARLGRNQTYGNSKSNQKKGRAGLEYSVAHWRFLEFGTSSMSAQPFMRPALANNIGKVTDTVAASLGPALDAAVKAAGKRAEKASK